MKFNSEDPRLTAYALGEMDEAERKAFEAEIAGSAEAGRAVAEIRAAASALSASLGKEPAPRLAERQRQAIERKARPAAAAAPLALRPPASPAGSGTPFGLWAGLAASVVLAVAVGYALVGPRFSRRMAPSPSVTEIERDERLRNIQHMNRNEEREKKDTLPSLRSGGAPPEWAIVPPRVTPTPREIAGFPKHEREYKSTKGFMGGGGGPAGDAESLGSEAYGRFEDNPFFGAAKDPLSTFSIDVDTASYANVRRFLNEGRLPPKDAVRIEEMVNYFRYDDAPPRAEDEAPFAVRAEVAACPWKKDHRLVRIGVKGREIEMAKRPATNLVFLVDVSGSMEPSDRLPLLKSALGVLVEQLGKNDRVAIVVYAGAAGLVLPSTPCNDKMALKEALGNLGAGGSTNGGAGILLAYGVARANFIKGGVNRVILCTDGDFNVGVTGQGELVRLAEEQAKDGVFLTVLGFGRGNLKDATMEQLADKGNGNYAYIDTMNEAKKALGEQASGTLITIAKDVKIQVEFNPAKVGAYRLIGYENRVLAHQDFNDDKKDAGEIGAGHTVTALYEVVPAGVKIDLPDVDPLKYQTPVEAPKAEPSDELLTVKIRHKEPEGDKSKLLTFPVKDGGASYEKASEDFQFAAAVAAFGMVLRDSAHKGSSSWDLALELAKPSAGADKGGYRAEFVKLIEAAKKIQVGKSKP